MDRDEEDRLLQAAVERGLLRASDVALAERERGRQTAPVAGHRVELLVQRGLLAADDVAALDPAVTPSAGLSVAWEDELAGWDRYRVLGVLGRGGRSVVYLAHDPRLDRDVALKILDGNDGVAEARIQARLAHEHVCQVFEVGEVARSPYIAMQYVDGKTLGEAATEMTVPEVGAAVRDVAMAVAAANELGLIHRDLKPANVMVDRGGKAYVLDFGLARSTEARRTVTGTALSPPRTSSRRGTAAGAARTAPPPWRRPSATSSRRRASSRPTSTSP